MPTATRIIERRRTLKNNLPGASPCSILRPRENGIATPTIHRKNGKIRSVNVQPFHSAWSRGEYIFPQSPGLFTRSIAAMVAPRKTSSDSKRVVGADELGAVATEGVGLSICCPIAYLIFAFEAGSGCTEKG